MNLLLKYQEKFTEPCRTSNLICVDETIASYQGRFAHLVYCSQKPDKWGMKLLVIYDSTTGYCLRMIPKVKKADQTLETTIIELIETLTVSDIGYLFCDSYYTSIALLQYLKAEWNIDCNGTIRKRRTQLPKSQKKEKRKESAKSFIMRCIK